MTRAPSRPQKSWPRNLISEDRPSPFAGLVGFLRRVRRSRSSPILSFPGHKYGQHALRLFADPGTPPISCPNGARLAFYVGVNVEHYEVDKPSTGIFGGTSHLRADPLNYGWRDYSLKVGIWRLIEALDRHGMRATVLLNSGCCRLIRRSSRLVSRETGPGRLSSICG